MKEALWWRTVDQQIQCELCPHRCRIANNHYGLCNVRQNRNGRLFSAVYGKPIAVHMDPVEKKPLYHFFPGTEILSIGTIGCNLFCKFCQNWDIARAKPGDVSSRTISPQAVVDAAVSNNSIGIAFTYNEPTVFGEYVLDIARLAHESGLKTVMVTNGFISPEAVPDIYPHIDAANIDLKSFSAGFYRRYCGGELQGVLDAILAIKEQGTFLELTTLIIPGVNDNESENETLIRWILDNLGSDTPLHFSAFHPSYKMTHLPRTPKATLDRIRKIALDSGLHYVYEGNVITVDEGNTYCRSCGRLLIRRQGYHVETQNLRGNVCVCGTRNEIIVS